MPASFRDPAAARTARPALIIGLMYLTLLATRPNCGAAVRGNEIRYVGGSMLAIAERTLGKLELSDAQVARFIAKRNSFDIVYKNITSLEYGQQVGRRVALAIMISPAALLSKKRQHYLSVGFVDGHGHIQAAVLEVGKEYIHAVVTILERRSSNVKLEFESEEAEKHFKSLNLQELLLMEKAIKEEVKRKFLQEGSR